MKDKVMDKCIYFLSTLDNSKIKIGSTTKLKECVLSIARSSPVPLILHAFIPDSGVTNTMDVLEDLLDRFSDDKLSVGWFRFSDDIAMYIKTNKLIKRGKYCDEINIELLRWYSQPDSKRRALARKANRFIDNEILSRAA